MNAIPQKPANYIRALAIAFKIIAAIEAIGFISSLISEIILEMRSQLHSHVFIMPIFVMFFLALLVVVPNRWIVRSPILYQICFFIGWLLFVLILLRVCAGIILSDFAGRFGIDNFLMMGGIMLLFLPWPLSLVLSRIRFKKGESFWYA
jgi:hypothetical protein